MTFINPQYLVETAWLEAHLNDPALRILDCTVLFATDANGIHIASGRDAWGGLAKHNPPFSHESWHGGYTGGWPFLSLVRHDPMCIHVHSH